MIHDVVSDHSAMAAFLWDVRRRAVRSHHYTLADIADLEERIDANLDGVQIAGEPGWQIAREALATEEPGAFFVAAVSCAHAKDLRGFAAVLDAASSGEGFLDGVEGALAWVSPEAAMHLVGPLEFGWKDERLSRLALSAFADHRRDPGYLVEDLMSCPLADVRARALRAAGELGRGDLVDSVRAAWAADDPEVRFWAGWTGALLAIPGASDVLWRVAAEPHVRSEQAADVAARAGAPRDTLDRIRAYCADPSLARVAICAAGALGDPALLPWLLDLLAVPPFARLAAEMVSRITGIAILGPLRAEPPKGFDSGPNDDPRDSRVLMDPDTFLPWPDPAALRAACEKRAPLNDGAESPPNPSALRAPLNDGGEAPPNPSALRAPLNDGGEAPPNPSAPRARSLSAGVRHIEGKPWSEQGLSDVLGKGTQLRREGAAFELALRSPGKALFATGDRAKRQRLRLGGAL